MVGLFSVSRIQKKGAKMQQDYGMDGDSNSWASDVDQGDGDYGSDYSEAENILSGVRPGAQFGGIGTNQSAAMGSTEAGKAAHVKGKHAVRKAVNRGRWTKEEVGILPSLFFTSLKTH